VQRQTRTDKPAINGGLPRRPAGAHPRGLARPTRSLHPVGANTPAIPPSGSARPVAGPPTRRRCWDLGRHRAGSARCGASGRDGAPGGLRLAGAEGRYRWLRGQRAAIGVAHPRMRSSAGWRWGTRGADVGGAPEGLGTGWGRPLLIAIAPAWSSLLALPSNHRGMDLLPDSATCGAVPAVLAEPSSTSCCQGWPAPLDRRTPRK
jgi:hypothetical protein